MLFSSALRPPKKRRRARPLAKSPTQSTKPNQKAKNPISPPNLTPRGPGPARAPASSYARRRRARPPMPSPRKERPSGRLGRLLAALRPSRAGPLPVQTGFPTSLADLVVKNHGRLKKQPSPSSKRGKRAAASPTPSVSPSPSTSPPPASPPPPPPAAAISVSPSDRPRPDLPPAPHARRGKGQGGGFALGLGFLAVSGVVSLALLVIWSKKVVAAVTAASFSLFLLESVRSSLRPRRPRPAATERQICLEGRGRVSPIREVDAETEPPRPSCSDTDRGSEASILDESSSPKAKKRSWKKKLIASAKKLNKGRKSKEADSPGSFRSDGDPASAADPSDSRRGMANQTEAAVGTEPDSLRGSRRSSEDIEEEIVAAPVEIDDAPSVALVEEEEGRRAGSQFPAGLILVAVVLVGLVAGKLPAVALTVLCYAFLSSVVQGVALPGRRSEASSVSS